MSKNKASLFLLTSFIFSIPIFPSSFLRRFTNTSISPSSPSNPSTKTLGVSEPTVTTELPVLISAFKVIFLSITSANKVVEALPFINTTLYLPFSTLANSYSPFSLALTTFNTLPPWINWTLALLPLAIVPLILNVPSTTFIGLTTYFSSLNVTLCAGFK